MRLINEDDVLNRITNPYERAIVSRWTREAPTIEAVPERKKGRWVRKTDGKLIWWECSECGEFPLKSVFNRQDVLSEYCPNCGASMTEGEKE